MTTISKFIVATAATISFNTILSVCCLKSGGETRRVGEFVTAIPK